MSFETYIHNRAVSRWQTDALHAVLLESNDRGIDATSKLGSIPIEINDELAWRGEALAQEWARRPIFPVLLHAQVRDLPLLAPLVSSGVLLWLELDAVDLHPRNEMRLFDLLQCQDDFRTALEGGIVEGQRAAGKTDSGKLQLSLARVPRVLPAAKSRQTTQQAPVWFKDASGGLAAACFANWYARGLWPDRPIGITGAIDSRQVRPVGHIADKHAAACQHGLACLVTVGDDHESIGHATCPLLRVGPPRSRDNAIAIWIRHVEAVLHVHGVRLIPHPQVRSRPRINPRVLQNCKGAADDRPISTTNQRVHERLCREHEQVEELEKELELKRERLRHLLQYVDRSGSTLSGMNHAAEHQFLAFGMAATEDPLKLAELFAMQDVNHRHAIEHPLFGELARLLSRGIHTHEQVGDIDPQTLASFPPDDEHLAEALLSRPVEMIERLGRWLDPFLLHALFRQPRRWRASDPLNESDAWFAQGAGGDLEEGRYRALQCALPRLKSALAAAVAGDQVQRAREIREVLIDTLAPLAGIERRRGNYGAARTLLKAALHHAPDRPYPLGNLIELHLLDGAAAPEIRIAEARNFLGSIVVDMQGAAEQRASDAARGIDLPWSHFDAGKFNLLLTGVDPTCSTDAINPAGTRPPERCPMNHYLLGVSVANSSQNIRSASKTFEHLQKAGAWTEDLLPQKAEISSVLDLAVNVLETTERRLPPKHKTPASTALIVAGRCARAASDHMRRTLTHLIHGFGTRSLTLLSGGTTAGVAGLVGSLAEQRDAGAEGLRNLRIVGCHPRTLPAGDEIDKRYDVHWSTPAATYGRADVIHYWDRLTTTGLASGEADRPLGIHPTEVRLVCFGGGALSGFEVRLALALRAPCVVICSDERHEQPMTPEWLCQNPSSRWRDHPLLTCLTPHDALADNGRCVREALHLPEPHRSQ